MREETRKPTRGAGESSGAEKPWWVAAATLLSAGGRTPTPHPESHPCSVAQAGGGHSGREVGSTGRVRSRSGRDRQVPAGAGRVGASFAGCWREREGHPSPLRLRLLPSPVCPLQCRGAVGRVPPFLHRFAHRGTGGDRPHPGAVLDPGAVALPVLFVYRRQEGGSGRGRASPAAEQPTPSPGLGAGDRAGASAPTDAL